MNAKNDPEEFTGDLEKEDKAFIFDLVVRECRREWDSLDESQYQCVQQCVICSTKNALGLEASVSVDLRPTYAQNDFTFPFEKRKMFISQLVHEFFENKWKAKQMENKMLRTPNLKGSLLEKDKSTLTSDISRNDERVPPLQNDTKLDKPLQTLQIILETVKKPECSGPMKVKTVRCSKLYNESDIQPEHFVKKRKDDSVCENSKLMVCGSEKRSKNTSLKRPRNETENDVLCKKSIDIDMEPKYGEYKKSKLSKKTSLEQLEKLLHLNKKYNSLFAAKTVVRTEKETDLLNDILENLLKRTNYREKGTQNEFFTSTNRRYSGDLRKPKPPYYTRDRFPNNRYSTEHRQRKPTYYTRGDSSRNNKHPSNPRNPKPIYDIKVERSQTSCTEPEKKFHLCPHDDFKPEYKDKHYFKREVERAPDKAESVVCLPVNNTSAAFALNRQRG